MIPIEHVTVTSSATFPRFMQGPELNQVSKKVIDLMDSINEILKIDSGNTSNLLSSLGILKIKCLLDSKAPSYQMSVESVSDAFLNSIDAQAVCEWVAKPFPEEENKQDHQNFYGEFREGTCLVFQETLPLVHERLLRLYQGSLAKNDGHENFERVFQEFSRRLVISLPDLGKIQCDLITLRQEAQKTRGESLKDPRFLDLANKIYLVLRSNRYGLFDEHTAPMKEVCLALRRNWIVLERSLVEEAKKSHSDHLLKPGLSEALLGENSQAVTLAWHNLLKENCYQGDFIPFRERGVSLNHALLEVDFSNVFQSKLSFQFHAPLAIIDNLKHFSLKPVSKKANIEFDFSNDPELTQLSFSTKTYYNCMSFGVGRKTSREIPPAGKEPTPHKLWEVVQQLKDCGCIHLEELSLSLPIEESSKEPSYLAAFVHDSGGGESGNPDCHVYRCFFDPANKSPIWMELLKQGGSNAIKFATRQGDQKTLIRGIPADPWNWFCKGNWSTFVGYWLVPPEAKFIVKEVMQEKTISFYREQEASIVI